jgi:hypothetical protein
MTQPEQPLQHPAAAYYPGPAYAANQPKDLTALGILAFASAALATVFACVTASVLGRAIRVRSEEGINAFDWSLPVYYLGELLMFLSLLAGFVTGSMWLHRARRNAEVLEPRGEHARRSGWAWGGWVTPVVAFWFPFQVVRDVRRVVSPRSAVQLIGWWWALFLLTEVLAWYSLSLQGNALVDFRNGDLARGYTIIGAAFMVAALAGWGQVLRVVTTEQHDRLYGRIDQTVQNI